MDIQGKAHYRYFRFCSECVEDRDMEFINSDYVCVECGAKYESAVDRYEMEDQKKIYEGAKSAGLVKEND